MADQTQSGLHVILQLALHATNDLIAALPEADQLIHNPLRAISYAGDRVTGNTHQTTRSPWPDPQMRQIWLTVTRATTTAHHHLAQAAHLTTWKPPHGDRPASLPALQRGLHLLREDFRALQHLECAGGLPDRYRAPAHAASRAILAAHQQMPAIIELDKQAC